MIDKDLYKKTFAHLHASGSEIKQEGKHMRQGHIRKGVVVAAAAALTVTAAGAANIATDGALLDSISVVFTGEVIAVETEQDGSTTYSVKGEDGSDLTITLPNEAGQDGTYETQYRQEDLDGDGVAETFGVYVDENGTGVAIEEGADTDIPQSVTITESGAES